MSLQMAPSSCNYYNISEENVRVILDGTGNITQIQVVKESIFTLSLKYDFSGGFRACQLQPVDIR